MHIELEQQDGFTFMTHIRGHSVTQDTKSVSGGKDLGPSPKELLLASVVGCSAMDVVGFLKKERLAYTTFKVLADAEQTKEHPRVFQEIHLTYQIDGPEVRWEPVADAIDLSLTLYCGVTAMIAKVVPVRYTLAVNGVTKKTGKARFWE